MRGNLLRSNQVTEMLQISESTLLRWEKQGLIPFKRIGRKLKYYFQDDVLELAFKRSKNLG